MSRRRVAVSPDPEALPALTLSARKGVVVVINGVTFYPPTAKRPTWRLKYIVDGKATERSGGTSIGTAWAAYEEMNVDLNEVLVGGSRTGAEKGRASVADLVSHYVAQRGANGLWKDRTVRDRTADLRPLATRLSAVRCEDLTAAHVRSILVEQSGTHGRFTHVLSVIGTMLRWGWQAGYLTKEQSEIRDAIGWVTTTEYVRAPTRRQQAKDHAPAKGAGGGNVMTHGQVTAWADACAKRDPKARLMIHLAALTGLRSGELLLLTADPAVAEYEHKNLVDLVTCVLEVRWQGEDGRRPKGSKTRDVAIPWGIALPVDFDLMGELQLRCDAALAEQAAGTNPFALLFPTATGKVWNMNNLRQRVWGPAADELGWRMKTYTTTHGNTRALHRFTLHALRARYATTVQNEWNWTEEHILQQGAWESGETVRRHYSGTTDDTGLVVREKMRRLATEGAVKETAPSKPRVVQCTQMRRSSARRSQIGRMSR